MLSDWFNRVFGREDGPLAPSGKEEDGEGHREDGPHGAICESEGAADAVAESAAAPGPGEPELKAEESSSALPASPGSGEGANARPLPPPPEKTSSAKRLFGGIFGGSDNSKKEESSAGQEVGAGATSSEASKSARADVRSLDSEEGSTLEETIFSSDAPDSEKRKPCIDDFAMIRVLGQGSYGKVVLVRKKDTEVMYAMKVLKKGDVVRKRQVERTKIERRVLGYVEHPFLMKLHYAFQTGHKLYLVLDYCPGGELFFHLSRFKRFPEGVVRFYAAELVMALKHLHENGIIYRDIKPENVLLDRDGHLKLGDFGLAKDNVTEATQGAQSVCGTPEYMAPEVINKSGHGTAVDWWGLGMLMYEMLTGLPPWYTKDRQKLFERLRSAPLQIPKSLSPQAAGIISGLLTRNPMKRLGANGATEVMDHEFFRGLDWNALLEKRIPAPLNPCRNQGPNSDSTHNFDPQFTRMPINTVAAAGPANESLSFAGFTYEPQVMPTDEDSAK
jgi:serine/threonine protein kinase